MSSAHPFAHILSLALLASGCAGPAAAPPPDQKESSDQTLHVTSQAELRSVRQQSELLLRELIGVDLSTERIEVFLTTKRQLLRKAGPSLAHPSLRGFTEVEETFHDERLHQRRFRMFVLKDLPQTTLIGVLCHELFHVWQVVHGAGSGEEAFREGAATYVQHRVLLHLNAKIPARRLREDPDPIYGGGLRRFLQLVESQGERKALQLAVERSRFP